MALSSGVLIARGGPVGEPSTPHALTATTSREPSGAQGGIAPRYVGRQISGSRTKAANLRPQTSGPRGEQTTMIWLSCEATRETAGTGAGPSASVAIKRGR